MWLNLTNSYHIVIHVLKFSICIPLAQYYRGTCVGVFLTHSILLVCNVYKWTMTSHIFVDDHKGCCYYLDVWHRACNAIWCVWAGGGAHRGRVWCQHSWQGECLPASLGIDQQQDWHSKVSNQESCIINSCKLKFSINFIPTSTTCRSCQINVCIFQWSHLTIFFLCCRYFMSKGSNIDKFGGDLNSTPLHWATR